MPILNGAAQTLEQCTLLVIEAYNFDIELDSLRFWELCSLLETKGFRPIDFCSPMLRPRDEAFWQLDILFVRSDRREFDSHSYQ